MSTAVMISNMGGPDCIGSVEPYLFNIFKDPDIIDIPLPEFLRLRFAGWLAKKRAPESRGIYEQIGGKSPLLDITLQQAELLQTELRGRMDDDVTVFTAMRYWHPLIEDVWKLVIQGGFTRLVVLTLYPFYSTTTTGSLMNLIGTLNADRHFSGDNLLLIDRFGNHPLFIQAMAEQIMSAVREMTTFNGDPVHVLLSAHSIPMKRIRKGDPYRDEIETAIAALKQALPANVEIHHAYQSKLGPVRWLSPATPEKIDELAEKGTKELFAYPLGFVADNSETTYEIGILYRNRAVERGIRAFHRIDALNTHPAFIRALVEIIMEKSKT